MLGRPIGTDDFCNEHTQKRVDKATELLIVYSLCVVPHHKHRRALRNFVDNSVRDYIESFLCSSFTDTVWSLAGLSTKMGGLGLRNLELHSSAAFLSSQAAIHDLCIELDPSHN